MISGTASKADGKLRRPHALRLTSGVLAMLAMLMVVICGLRALAAGHESWSAMKVPLTLAIVLLWVFARTAKGINVRQAKLRKS